MHLGHDNQLTCTHSIAECVEVIAISALAGCGAAYVYVTWDDVSSTVTTHHVWRDSDSQAIAEALLRHDPFQLGAQS